MFVLLLVSLLAMLASFPCFDPLTQTVRLVVPTPAGSSVDVVARIVAEQLGTRLGQTVIVETRAEPAAPHRRRRGRRRATATPSSWPITAP